MYVKKCLLKRKKYCSRVCLGKNTDLAKGLVERPKTPWNKGKKLHYDVWNKGLKGFMAGEKNCNWKNGKTSLSDTIRTDSLYKEWRKIIFERDNYTCQVCNKRGGKLNADHIYPISLVIDEECITKENYRKNKRLWDLENGRTLCEYCHKKTDTYGVNFIRWNKKRTAQSGTVDSLNLSIIYGAD